MAVTNLAYLPHAYYHTILELSVAGVVPPLKVRASTHAVIMICRQLKVSCGDVLQLNVVRTKFREIRSLYSKVETCDMPTVLSSP